MEERKIYPILINRNRMTDYYNMLFEKGFQLKVFKKEKDDDIYDYFLPLIRNLMFWTFDIDKIEEFNAADTLTKATICKEYKCNIFYKGESEIVCFEPGIIFVVTESKEVIEEFVKESERKNLEKINIRADRTYNFSGKEKGNEEEDPNFERAHLYAYLIQLYKAVYLNKVNKEVAVEDTFDRTRKEFVDFTQNIFNVQITDKDKILIEIDRIKDAVSNEKFINKIYTTKEISYCESTRNMKFQHYGARFAGKEATFKAISAFLTTPEKFAWKNIEITNKEDGKPQVEIINYEDEGLKNVNLEISLSHVKDYAVAYVTAYKE